MSCAFASLHLRQQTVSTGGNTRAGQEDFEPRTGQEIIGVGVRFRSTSAFNRAMHADTDTEPSRLAPLPRQRRSASAGLRRWRRALRRYLERSFENVQEQACAIR